MANISSSGSCYLAESRCRQLTLASTALASFVPEGTARSVRTHTPLNGVSDWRNSIWEVMTQPGDGHPNFSTALIQRVNECPDMKPLKQPARSRESAACSSL